MTTATLPEDRADIASRRYVTDRTFATTRSLDYFSEVDLRRQAGVSRYDWGLMLVKVAIDNSLDACELSGVSPQISVVVSSDRIIVQDNGPGIPHDTVRKVQDFGQTVSSNRHRVQPSRGQQGNAWKTFLAVPGRNGIPGYL